MSSGSRRHAGEKEMSLRGCSKLFQLQVSFVVVVVVVLFSFKLRGHRYASTFPCTLRYEVIATKGCKRKEKFLSSR